MLGSNKDQLLYQIVDSFKRILEVAKDGALVGIKKRLNFIAGTNVTLDVVDNPGTKSVDITINSTGGGGSGVPTTRLVNTTSPILGGGDLSADRTLSFDGTAALNNNARVAVKNNGTPVGTRRNLNFLPGTNVTYTIADDAGNEEVDITINASGVSDGDKGDVVVSGSGSVFTIDTDVVSDTKLRNSAGNSVIGRSANTVGDPADIVASADDLPLRRNAGVLAFGAIPESSVTNLVSDLAAKVPTTRNLSVASPITGGGDLSADRSFGFDQTVDLGNKAKVGVKNNGAAVGTRRHINFIPGTNITYTITDDAGNDEVDVTINSSGGGGGSGLSHAQVMSRAFLR
jgi:hypothetical protein